MVMWYGSFVRGGLVVKRKLFHALALVLFCPPLLMAFELLKLALGVAFGILLLLEIVRANDSTSYYMKIFPFEVPRPSKVPFIYGNTGYRVPSSGTYKNG